MRILAQYSLSRVGRISWVYYDRLLAPWAGFYNNRARVESDGPVGVECGECWARRGKIDFWHRQGIAADREAAPLREKEADAGE